MKILIAEDDAVSRLVLTATLKKLGCEVVATASGTEAWDTFQQEHFPLLISDWMMPDMDGLELCQKIRAERGMQYTYIILLTARGGKTNYLDAMDAGADDFVTKPFDEDQLAARLRVAQRILALHEILRTQAMHDPLTGLWNRAAILDDLRAEMDRAARDGTSIGVMLVDLDHFKHINDTHGHPVGDAVLREAARRMRASLRTYDRIGRYGGEEFLIVTPQCATHNAMAIAERVRNSIGGEMVKTSTGMLPITSSLGVAVSRSGARHDADTVIQAADEALYRAKEKGRNRTELADERTQLHDSDVLGLHLPGIIDVEKMIEDYR